MANNKTVIQNISNRVQVILNDMKVNQPTIGSVGLGNFLPIDYTAPLFWFKGTDILVKRVDAVPYAFLTYDVYYLDNIADSTTLTKMNALLDVFTDNYASYLTFTNPTEGTNQLVTNKGYSRRGFVIQVNLDTFETQEEDDCGCDVTKVAGDPGFSAYEVWLAEGNVGTEQDFFEYIAMLAAIGVITINEIPGLRDELDELAEGVATNSTDIDTINQELIDLDNEKQDKLPTGIDGQILTLEEGEPVWVDDDPNVTAGLGIAVDAGEIAVDNGQGLTFNGNQLTLDLASTTLVSPTITRMWSVYQNDGTTLLTNSSAASITAETGSKVNISATYQYPAAGAGQSLPTSVTGSWGTTLPGPATPSAPFTNSGTQITANSTYSVTLAKPKSGLIVVSSQVQFPTGNDTTSASISVSFLAASYFGYSANSTLTGAQIKALGNKNLQSGRARTVNDVTSGVSNYTYYCYPASAGALTSIIQNGALPVLTAFTRLADVVITTDSGISVTMAVYKSNALNAFTDVDLVIS